LNVLIVGPTGVGKSWVAAAIGNQACREGMSVLFCRASELYSKLADAHADGSMPTLKAKLVRPALLILDDLGLGHMTPTAAQVLLDIMDRRQHTGSLIITSQFPPGTWHDFFPEPTVADAVLDRIVHQSHRLSLKGESLRKKRGEQRLKASGLSTASE
jgi:DNA replication protein DnaC